MQTYPPINIDSLQGRLAMAGLMIREGLPGLAALELHILQREAKQAADNLGDRAVETYEAQIASFDASYHRILFSGELIAEYAEQVLRDSEYSQQSLEDAAWGSVDVAEGCHRITAQHRDTFHAALVAYIRDPHRTHPAKNEIGKGKR